MFSIILLSCITGHALIAIYLFNTLKLKSDLEKILNVLLVILFFHLATKFFMLVILKNSFLYCNNASGFGLSYGPLLYIAVRILKRNRLTKKSLLLHMFPFALGTAIYFISCAGYMAGFISVSFIDTYAFVYQWIVAASLFCYPLIAIRTLRLPEVAPQDRFILQLLKNIAYIIISGTSAGLTFAGYRFVITGFHDFDIRLIPYISMSVIPALILRYKMKSLDTSGQMNWKQEKVDDSQPYHEIREKLSEEILTVTIIPVEKRYRKSALDNQMLDDYELSLTKYMAKSKIYLETEVSLEALAEKAVIPKHHLTQLLNERFGKNFYTYINEYRIAEAVEKLKSNNPPLSILSLAYDCGFNSKSSFNNYFKKVTGFTPSAYRKECGLSSIEETFLSA